jgi:hypothetical protein
MPVADPERSAGAWRSSPRGNWSSVASTTPSWATPPTSCGPPPSEFATRCQPDPADPRPWERWGAARRDCAPHRGNVLLLAWTAWVLGLSSFCLGVTGWAAVPLAWAVHGLA